MKLLVGLGNPGPDYQDTRHNAGVWFCQALAQKAGVSFQYDKKYNAETARVSGSNSQNSPEFFILLPQTFMNLSGASVQPFIQFYKILPEEILVVHDDLDLPPGTIRLKQGGGHGGHNGLRDLIQRMGPKFWRLRVGIGHPGDPERVTGFVLGRPPLKERELIDHAIVRGLGHFDLIHQGQMNQAMQGLHTQPK